MKIHKTLSKEEWDQIRTALFRLANEHRPDIPDKGRSQLKAIYDRLLEQDSRCQRLHRLSESDRTVIKDALEEKLSKTGSEELEKTLNLMRSAKGLYYVQEEK